MGHLKTEESPGQLGLQKIDEEKAGCHRAEHGHDQSAGPGLGKNEADQECDKKKSCKREAQGGQEKIVGN